MKEKIAHKFKVDDLIEGCIILKKQHVFNDEIIYYPCAYEGDIEVFTDGRELNAFGCSLTKKYDRFLKRVLTVIDFFGKSEANFRFDNEYQISLEADIPHLNVGSGMDVYFFQDESFLPECKFIMTEDDRNTITLYSLQKASPPIEFILDDLIRDTLINQQFENYRASARFIN